MMQLYLSLHYQKRRKSEAFRGRNHRACAHLAPSPALLPEHFVEADEPAAAKYRLRDPAELYRPLISKFPCLC
jgi:hypothetical protein